MSIYHASLSHTLSLSLSLSLSYGVVMWELLTGEKPYGNLNAFVVAYGVGRGTLSLPIPAGCPASFQELMDCESLPPLLYLSSIYVSFIGPPLSTYLQCGYLCVCVYMYISSLYIHTATASVTCIPHSVFPISNRTCSVGEGVSCMLQLALPYPHFPKWSVLCTAPRSIQISVLCTAPQHPYHGLYRFLLGSGESPCYNLVMVCG